jgi:DNA-binding MarR family transcriptional regulator
MTRTRSRASAAPRARIRTARSPYFQVLVFTNLTAKPFHERFGKRLRIGLPEWRVMMVVADRPGITAQELADYTGLDKMSVSRAVRALQARGRLQREQSAADRRRLHLALTPAGWKIYATIADTGLERERQMFAALSARERRTFAALLAKLLARARRTS